MTTEDQRGAREESPYRADFVFHGHFYQPPRENPWTDEVEREPSARPFHDWNARINSECYAANAASRIHDAQGRVGEIVNNYDRMSLNFGPTLLRWLERNDPETLRRIVDADRRSQQQHGGHGNAIAQTYNHMIMALADAHDRRTQIRWGLAEFEHRFGRSSESIWLAETAANHDVLDDLIDHGLRYVILAPVQAGRVRAGEDAPWQDVRGARVDPARPYRYRHRDGSDRWLAVFFYDGPLAQSVSFGASLRDGQALAGRVEAATPNGRPGPALVHLAVDGETASHHVTWGNLALAWALHEELPRRGYRITNYGEFLDRCPPTWDVELDLGPYGEGSSWSCAHGVGRWIRDCSCRIDPGAPTNQRWREPLRRALDLLRDEGRKFFLRASQDLLRDPWGARDDYIRLLLSDDLEVRRDFLREHGAGELDGDAQIRALTLLEMQHQMLLMYTSCGWFFDDIGGLESVQIMRYAARALELWEQLEGEVPRQRFLQILAEARSNDPRRGTGADIFRRDALAVRVSPERIVAHLAMSSMEKTPPEHGRFALHRFERRSFHLRESRGVRLVTGRFFLEHVRTLRPVDLQVAMLHTGALDFVTAVAPFDPDAFESIQEDLHRVFENEGPEALPGRLDHWFSSPRYGAEDLLEFGRQSLLEMVFHEVLDRFNAAYAELYEENREALADLSAMGVELPEELQAATRFTLRKRFEREFLEHAEDTDLRAHAQALEVVHEAMRHEVRLDSPVARRHFRAMLAQRLDDLAEALARTDEAVAALNLDKVEELLATADGMRLDLDRSGAQVIFHDRVRVARPDTWTPPLRSRLEHLARRLGFDATRVLPPAG